jgi:hypothetical protein
MFVAQEIVDEAREENLDVSDVWKVICYEARRREENIYLEDRNTRKVVRLALNRRSEL